MSLSHSTRPVRKKLRGESRVRSLPRGGAGTPGGRPESGPCPVEEGSPWEHLPTWGLCQKVLSAQPQAACRIIPPRSGCPRKGCGGQSPIHSKCRPWCQPWWAGCRLSTNQQEDATLSGQMGQRVKLTCPSVRL